MNTGNLTRIRNKVKSGKLISRPAGYLLLIAVYLLTQPPSIIFALSEEQRRLIDSGIYYFNQEGGLDCNLVSSVGSELPGNIPEPHNALFSRAAARFSINPQLLAAVFLTENGNQWRPFNHPWATSSAGASGPFQFMPMTWVGYQTDGNNDGVRDINNMYDAAYGAAKFLYAMGARVGTPLGTLETPFVRNSMLYIVAAYNWGPGNMQSKTTPGSPLSTVPRETEEYITNVYSLITSGFTKSGKAGYGDPSGQPGAGGIETVSDDCTSGVVSGSIVQTALNLAWPGPHEPKTEPKPQYRNAPPTSTSAGNCYGADCGVFVATVMRRSGADPSYPPSGTSVQAAYVKSNPQKYDVLQLGSGNTTSDLEPGDILIANAGSGSGGAGHTYIFVGAQPGGYNQASASWSSNCSNSRMPSLGTAEILDSLGRGYYLRARLK